MGRVRGNGWIGLLAVLAATGCTSLPSRSDQQSAVPFTDATTILASEPNPAASTAIPEAKPAEAKPAEPSPAEAQPMEAAKVADHAVDLASKTPDKSPDKIDVRIRGRINADADFVRQSAKDQAIVGTVNDGTGFRRARLGAEGNYEQISWVTEFDFAGGQIAFKDVYGQVNDLPVVRRFRVGHMPEPFSLEGQTSSNDFAFNERSSIMPLDPARNWGGEILSYTESERATMQLGAFRSGSSNNSGDDNTGQNDLAYDIRTTWLPWYDDSPGRLRLWHVGGAFSERSPANNVVIINQGPQTSLLSTTDNPGSPFEPQITIPASEQQLYNLQTALVLGSLSFQAEWTATHIQQIGGGPVFLDGCYGFVSWFPTGENRSYLTRDGKFGGTKVLSPFACTSANKFLPAGTGAWELTARFAYTNFDNPNIPLSNGLKVGDREAAMTLGVNWYLTDNFRFMFNWVHAIPVDPNFGPSYADVFMLRTAIFW
jgi:phosphate-selective porin OprO and OprP